MTVVRRSGLAYDARVDVGPDLAHAQTRIAALEAEVTRLDRENTVLRQHLANAVFRAIETNRPVLRVTNVGITAYITENGTVLDPLPVYQEGTRVWTVSKSDGSQTFYVKYGDWFAWLCTIVTIMMSALGFRRRSSTEGEG